MLRTVFAWFLLFRLINLNQYRYFSSRLVNVHVVNMLDFVDCVDSVITTSTILV